MLPRLIGHGPATIWVDDVSLRKTGSIDEMRAKDAARPRCVDSNARLEVIVRYQRWHDFGPRPRHEAVVEAAAPRRPVVVLSAGPR